MPKNEIRAYLGINEIAEEGTRSFSISYNFSNHIRGISVHSYANGGQTGRQIRSSYNFSVHPRHAWLFNSFGCFDAARGHASRARSLIEYLRVLTRNIRSKVDAARAQLGTVYNFVQSL